MKSRTVPVTEISVFVTEISVTGIEKLSHERLSPVTETTFFYTKIASLTQHSPQKAIVLVLFVFPLLENAN